MPKGPQGQKRPADVIGNPVFKTETLPTNCAYIRVQRIALR